MPLKPQDLLVCLALVDRGPGPWAYSELAGEVGLSVSEANGAVQRASAAGLLAEPLEPRGKPTPVRAALLGFLSHGVRHAFYVKPGRIVRGMPTAHSAPPLRSLIESGEESALVWPDELGDRRGQAIEPLYPSVPAVARKNQSLYELLALTDALRCGRTRERELALSELRQRLNIDGKR